MKVRFLTSLAGAREAYETGEIVDLPEEKARPWIAGGICEEVTDDTDPRPREAIEAAEARLALETAAIRRARRASRP